MSDERAQWAESLRQLDDDLLTVLGLCEQSDLTGARRAIDGLCEHCTHVGNRIGAEPGKLLGPTWRHSWRVGVPFDELHRSAPIEPPQVDALYAVFVALVRFLREVSGSFDEPEVAGEVSKAIKRYLSRRGRRIANYAPPRCHVTLQQMAALVNKSKAAIEKLKEKGKLPPADVKGGSGRADEWNYDVVRPILESHFGRSLPATFPADRFMRR